MNYFMGTLILTRGVDGLGLELLRQAMISESVELCPLLSLVSAEEYNVLLFGELKEIKRAVAASEHAIKSLRQSGVMVPPELWNNVGVLYSATGNLHQAEEAFLMPFADCDLKSLRFEDVFSIISKARLVPYLITGTLRMNLAQLYLSKGQLSKVQQLAPNVELRQSQHARMRVFRGTLRRNAGLNGFLTLFSRGATECDSRKSGEVTVSSDYWMIGQAATKLTLSEHDMHDISF